MAGPMVTEYRWDDRTWRSGNNEVIGGTSRGRLKAKGGPQAEQNSSPPQWEGGVLETV